MPYYDESGNKKPIEDVFHGLTKRLLDIAFLIERKEQISSMNEDVLEEIKKQITTYSFDEALATLKTNLDDIEELLNKLEQKKDDIVVTGRWGDTPFESNNVESLNAELVNYQSVLIFIKAKLDKKQARHQQHLSDIDYPKIETNLTVEEVAGLLYFLLKHQTGLIKSNITHTCNVISKVITTVESKNPDAANLRNEMYKIPAKREILNFWRSKFNTFSYDFRES